MRLAGRLSAEPEERVLPSGDALVAFRVVVPRLDRGADTIDCCVRGASLRARAVRIPPGTPIEVEGALRRRFWRAGGAVASRYEVEVTALRRARSVG